MTTLSLRLNDVACMMPAELHEEELDTKNEKREVNRFLGWATWHSRCKLSTRQSRAKVKDWALEEDVKPLMQHLDGMRCFHHQAVLDKEEHMKNCCSQACQSRNGGQASWHGRLSTGRERCNSTVDGHR
jgi:hypothetical protein